MMAVMKAKYGVNSRKAEISPTTAQQLMCSSQGQKPEPNYRINTSGQCQTTGGKLAYIQLTLSWKEKGFTLVHVSSLFLVSRASASPNIQKFIVLGSPPHFRNYHLEQRDSLQ